jgi:phosphatidylethanolamine/phosphatidyl-N-methylethanolamine N-methyltransferase
MSAGIFLKELAKNWRGVGAVAPSSRFLTEKMLSKIDFSSARLVVELGPGTGPMTREILTRLRPDARLVVIESNETFCEMLRAIDDSRLSVECASAENLPALLDGERVDVILSGIPLASVGRGVAGRVLDVVKDMLLPGGVFVQFQYSKLSCKMIAERFTSVEIDFVPVNMPPAFVYTARV